MLKTFFSITIIILSLLVPSLVLALTTPSGLALTPGDQTIEVSWIANSDSTTDYYLYSGLTKDNMSPPLLIKGRDTNSHTLGGLLSNTTYYVAISAYDNLANFESDRSAVLTATTLDTSSLPAPAGLWIDSAFGIGTTYAGFSWTASSEPDVSYYTVHYGTVTGIYDRSYSTPDAATFLNVTGLSSSTRYYVALSMTDSTLSQSARSSEIVVDTLPDGNPPNMPGTPAAAISGSGEVEIRFSHNNDNMADFSHFIVAYDTVSTTLSFTANTGPLNAYVLGGLTIGTDYYFAVKAVDAQGNESAYSGLGHIYVEEVTGYLNESDMEEGCFIATAVFGSYDHPVVKVLREFRDGYLKNNVAGRSFIRFYYEKGPRAASFVKENPLLRVLSFLFLLPLIVIAYCLVKLGPLITTFLFFGPLFWKYRQRVAMFFIIALLLLWCPENVMADEYNTLGMKIGYFEPSHEDQSEYYEPTPLVSLFYDLKISTYLSTELSAGYLFREGNALTLSGKETAIESELTMVPLSLAVKFHLPVTRYIGTYVGAGGDYWYFREKSKISEEEIKVGGYHGRAGIVLKKLPNIIDDNYQRNFKVTLEAVYSIIDRFGNNKTDLGGWTFNAGASISF